MEHRDRVESNIFEDGPQAGFAIRMPKAVYRMWLEWVSGWNRDEQAETKNLFQTVGNL